MRVDFLHRHYQENSLSEEKNKFLFPPAVTVERSEALWKIG